ncbi:MAG: nucleoside triphosphate pyrophosphohydrolase [Fibrobacterota bacterium]
MKEFDKLYDIIKTLRGENGCPWDRAQTHKSILSDLIEESYEFIEAVDEESPEKMKEELGDLLIHVVFHSRIAEESSEFTLSDVIKGLNEKLTRRHPHVFGNSKANTTDQVKADWEKIKLSEKGKEDRKSVLDGIPVPLPALARSQKLQKKAARTGFDWPGPEPVIQKIREETEEIEAEIAGGDKERIMDEIGDLFFATVNLCRHFKIDSEDAMRHANRKFERRFRKLEEICAAEGRDMKSMSLEEMDLIWDEVKKKENKTRPL